MGKWSIAGAEKKEIGFFSAIELDHESKSISELIIKIQKNSSNSLSGDIFEGDINNVRNVEIWLAFDSKFDIKMSKINASKLKDTLLASPVAVLRLFIEDVTKESNMKVVNLLVKDLLVISKSKINSVYIRFADDFKEITKRDIYRKYSKTIANSKNNTKKSSKSIIMSEQKRKLNEEYAKVKQHYKMTKNKEYDVNLFSKREYHNSRIDVLKEYIYNEIIKTVLLNEEITEIVGDKYEK